MIDIGAAYSWLYYENPPGVSETVRYYIQRILDENLPDQDKKTILMDLYQSNIRLTDLQEKAEILAFCGQCGFQLGMIDDSGDWLENAAKLFERCDDTHRFAVGLWMLFIWRRAKGQYRLAFDHARKARKLFIAKADECKLRQYVEKESWYRGRIVDMTCDLVSAPEDLFELLFEFRGSSLSPSASDIKSRISSRLEKKQFTGIERDIDILLGITLRSTHIEETAEALTFCGVVAWVLEEKGEAINYFRSAMSQYIPNSFEYAVVQWMLGLALFDDQNQIPQAIRLMEKSTQDIDTLRQKAIHKNKLDHRDWFATYHMAMKRLLHTRVQGI